MVTPREWSCAEGQKIRKARGKPMRGEGDEDKAGTQMPKAGSVPRATFGIGEGQEGFLKG
jgi:hypothetical protein